ncbi:CLUMA_CG017119, isoform A [Clunio marinus]|uniref:CLUMA_CG017119, isoform A n=1 Tax=Clunio marinus TaxID=568069 RepID=A0A1J1IZJ2_9DIPT|nr:CLUMA_CG017119, isoform A [Clunio marinus]
MKERNRDHVITCTSNVRNILQTNNSHVVFHCLLNRSSKISLTYVVVTPHTRICCVKLRKKEVFTLSNCKVTTTTSALTLRILLRLLFLLLAKEYFI